LQMVESTSPPTLLPALAAASAALKVNCLRPTTLLLPLLLAAATARPARGLLLLLLLLNCDVLPETGEAAGRLC
jgi:hypothetical protein